MRIECKDFNSRCASQCFYSTTEEDVIALKEIGAFKIRHCANARGRARWYPDGFIGLVMQAIEESSNGRTMDFESINTGSSPVSSSICKK